MKLTQATSADLAPGDVVWCNGERIEVETTELRPAPAHGLPYWLINNKVMVSEGHTWTREERT
jgi:hypothetical protein